MFSSSRRHHTLDIWPGFVDAMATLLMVIVFVLMTFVVAQLYLTDALSGKENDVLNLESAMKELKKNLHFEKMSKADIEKAMETLTKNILLLEKQLGHMRAALQTSEKALIEEADEKKRGNHTIAQLFAQIEEMNTKLRELNDILAQSELEKKEKEEKIEALDAELTLFKKEKSADIKQFRSDFFAKLAKALGDRQDIRVVGDRFVFQSEVLFDQGSADIRPQGKTQLQTFGKTLQEISTRIPKDVAWILRIDGHTDKLPIKNTQFPSNWELSSARAISVVKFLASEGISPNNLVAAGFGEHQPLATASDPASLSKNRRIEFKLDQR